VLIIGGLLIIATTATAGPGVSTTTLSPSAGRTHAQETLAGTGNLHLLVTDNLSSSGMVQYNIEATFSGLQAETISPVAGKKYVVIDEEDQTDTFDLDGAPAQETVDHTLQFVRSGEDGSLPMNDDFDEHFLARITANANGTVTVQDVTLNATCK
jgi:hypothetical protein